MLRFPKPVELVIHLLSDALPSREIDREVAPIAYYGCREVGPDKLSDDETPPPATPADRKSVV